MCPCAGVALLVTTEAGHSRTKLSQPTCFLPVSLLSGFFSSFFIMVMVFCLQFALGNRVCPTSISILRLCSIACYQLGTWLEGAVVLCYEGKHWIFLGAYNYQMLNMFISQDIVILVIVLLSPGFSILKAGFLAYLDVVRSTYR